MARRQKATHNFYANLIINLFPFTDHHSAEKRTSHGRNMDVKKIRSFRLMLLQLPSELAASGTVEEAQQAFYSVPHPLPLAHFAHMSPFEGKGNLRHQDKNTSGCLCRKTVFPSSSSSSSSLLRKSVDVPVGQRGP